MNEEEQEGGGNVVEKQEIAKTGGRRRIEYCIVNCPVLREGWRRRTRTRKNIRKRNY